MLIQRLKTTFFFGILATLFSSVSFATPPDRPISITPESIINIQALKSDKKYFYFPLKVTTLNVKLGDVKLTVVVYTPEQWLQTIVSRHSTKLDGKKGKTNITTISKW